MEVPSKLENANYVLVPRAPTKTMVEAAWADALAEDAAGVWEAMIESWESRILGSEKRKLSER